MKEIINSISIRLPPWAKTIIQESATKKGIPLATEIRIRLCENCKKS
jgi:hypothetical protein